mmetsp:Transcript_44383/g.78004  ORF Transcript_44383/g.78004 Transcript_44383/m.78004 type:complete len:691 (+) Transcript_44383:113-2185(+)
MCALIHYCHQLLLNLLGSSLDSLQGAWLEALIIAAALHFYYFAHSKRGLLGGKVAHHSRTSGQPAGKTVGTSGPTWSALGTSEETAKVQKLVVSLLCQKHHCAPEALAQYDNIVRACRVDLRKHVPDDHHARSMYLALIGGAVSSPSEGNHRSSCKATRNRISRFLEDMQDFGFPRTVDFFASVQKLLVNHRMFQDALWLHDIMIEDGVTPNSSMYIGFMNVAISCKQWKRAIFFFEEGGKLGPPTMRTYMTVLRVHAQNKDWRTATKLLDRMEASGTRPDNLILNNILGLCISMGQVSVAERVLHQWKDIIDVVSCNILLKGFTQRADLTKAEQVLDRMGVDLPVPNLITYNTAMDCAVRAFQAVKGSAKTDSDIQPSATGSHTTTTIARRPWQFLDRLLAQGLTPDRYTCSTLVKGMHLVGCTISDIDRAVELLHTIGPAALQSKAANAAASAQDSNARLFEVLFNTLLDACISVHDLDRMVQIFEMMQDFQVSASAVTFGTLIKAFGQAGRLSRCKEVWKEMEQARIRPTMVTYGCYIDACIRNDDVGAAEEIFESMSASGVRANAVIYTSMIRGFAHSKQPGKALELYRRMQDAGIKASTVTFNSVLDAVARQFTEPHVLKEVLDDMYKAKILPTTVTPSVLQNALSVFKQLRSHNHVFDQVAFDTLLQACSKTEPSPDTEKLFKR